MKKKIYSILNIFVISIVLFSHPAYADKMILGKDDKQNENMMLQERVNINTASAEYMTKKLMGIGIKRAQYIVDYREKYGLFTDIEQLKEISGIGEAIFEKNKHILSL